jgi:hypothetical protein
LKPPVYIKLAYSLQLSSATNYQPIMANKYGPKAQEKVEKAMHEQKHGELKSSSGQKVTSKKQAIAIGLSEARAEGGKVPAKKSSGKKS